MLKRCPYEINVNEKKIVTGISRFDIKKSTAAIGTMAWLIGIAMYYTHIKHNLNKRLPFRFSRLYMIFIALDNEIVRP